MSQPGVAGEEAAENWLVQAGYLILERNYRMARGEVDLIAQRGDTLTFVEVKTSIDSKIDLLERVTRQKQTRICSAARAYLARHPTSLTPRFDVVTVQIADNKYVIQHYPSAFES